ncbi:hypothetical protein BVRB_6g149320 [Beta vulgaris subsp. vulgaris]|nr:hypothetical protein BVRB_6g149320 [Beta vulgaris subsp. vulgaris]
MAGALEFRKADDVVILLDHGQLRNLARILRLREAPLMSNLGSEVERIKYLDHVNDAHNKLVDLVTASEQHTQRYEQQNNQLKAEIAKAIEEYVVLAANWAMQCIRNVLMRLTCVEKLRDQFDGLVVELEKLDQNNQIDVEYLVEKLNKLKYYMWEYANTTRSEQARRRSREFSESLMMQGITVPHLLSRKASQLGFKGEFEDLEEQQKLQVYVGIINESKRAELPDLFNSRLRKLGILDKIDIAMLVVNSAVLVWDIHTTPYNLEMVVRDVTKLIGTGLELTVGIVVGAAVTTMTFNPVIGFIAASIASFVVASVVGFLFTAVTGGLLNFIFGSGGGIAPLNMDTLKFYAGEMPDGMEIAFNLTNNRMLED